MTEADIELYNVLFDRVKNKMNWDDTKTDTWFQLSNPLLGGLTPLTMLYLGRGWKLEAFINNLLEGNHG